MVIISSLIKELRIKVYFTLNILRNSSILSFPDLSLSSSSKNSFASWKARKRNRRIIDSYVIEGHITHFSMG